MKRLPNDVNDTSWLSTQANDRRREKYYKALTLQKTERDLGNCLGPVRGSDNNDL